MSKADRLQPALLLSRGCCASLPSVPCQFALRISQPSRILCAHRGGGQAVLCWGTEAVSSQADRGDLSAIDGEVDVIFFDFDGTLTEPPGSVIAHGIYNIRSLLHIDYASFRGLLAPGHLMQARWPSSLKGRCVEIAGKPPSFA